MVRSFRVTFMLIIVLAASLPVIGFSSLLVQKINTITSAAAVRELDLQVQSLAEVLLHELDLLKERLLTLAADRNVALTTRKTTLGVARFLSGSTIDHLRKFQADNRLQVAMYLLDAEAQIVDAAPAEVAPLDSAPVMADIKTMLAKTLTETTSPYVLVEFQDRPFLDQTVTLLRQASKAPGNQPIQSAYGLAIVVPLILDVTKEVTGALVVIIPVDTLATQAFERVSAPNILTFTRGEETLLTSFQTATMTPGADYLIRTTQFVLPNSEHGQPIAYGLRLAEPAHVRFAEVRATLLRLVLAILGAVLVLVVVAYGIARWLVLPFRTLESVVQAYAGGDYALLPPTVRFTEFQRFVATLHGMGQHILAQLTARQHAQDQLAEANAEITALNAQLQAENFRMGSELEVPRKLQQMLLPTPKELQQIADLDIACYMEPADEVGGDYYDILQHHGRITIGIGDVAGHGLESGVVMVMTQAMVRALLTNGETDPVRLFATLNRALYGNMQRMGTDKHLTLALLDYEAGEVTLSGQHEKMIVVRRAGTVEVVDTIDLGFPIALVDEIADRIAQTTVVLQPGDGLVLYTDGITEAENLAREQYGLARLCTLVSQRWAQPAEVIKAAVVLDVRRHMGTQRMNDDMALVVVKRRETSALCPMRGIFGRFIEQKDHDGEYLKIGFSPTSRPIQQRWRNNGLSADFLANYFTTFFVGGNQAAAGRQAELKGAVSYIANELLENAMKFSYAPSQHAVSLTMYLEAEAVSLYVTNSIALHAVVPFQQTIARLLTEDTDIFYMEQLTHNVESDRADGSGLGYLTMLHDYGVVLAWKFASSSQEPAVGTVTTMVRLSV